MKKGVFSTIVLIIVVLALAVIIFKPGSGASPEVIAFAQCLAEKNIVMYGAESCSWCQKEKAAFGDAFEYVPYVECPDEPQECLDKGIEGTPTWIFPGGKKLVGYQGLENLSLESGCPLP